MSGVARVWGLSPADGQVRIQAQLGGTWTDVMSGTARAGSVFEFRVRTGVGTHLRAVVGEHVSPEWVTA